MNAPAKPQLPGLFSECPAQRWDGVRTQPVAERVVEEVAVSLNYNGLAYAVMMTSPADLEDFALGFSLTEGVIAAPSQLHGIDVLPLDEGMLLRMQVDPACVERIEAQRRHMAGRTACGLCGAESIEQALRQPHAVADGMRTTHAALHRAFDALSERQTLNALTGAVHAAAWADADGMLQLVREDVGRHNALDKLAGALARLQSAAPGAVAPGGFVVVTSRGSYEMVHKAAAIGAAAIAAVSAPTSLAIETAEEAGIALVAFVRSGRLTAYANADLIAA